MDLWAAARPSRTVVFVQPPTNRFYPLPDGRDLSWSHWPVTNSSGHVVERRHTGGLLDGVPIDDEDLPALLDLHKVH